MILHRYPPGWLSAIVTLFLVAVICRGQELVVTPDKVQGVYSPGQTIRWKIQVTGARPTQATYVLKKGGLTEVAKASVTLTEGTGEIEASLDEPGWLLVEVSVRLDNDQTIKASGGALVSPEKIAPTAPRPADFDAFWQDKLKQLAEVPAAPKLTPADAGNPNVDLYQIDLNNIRGSQIRGQLARPKSGDKFPAMLIVQWAGVYPLQKSWVTGRAAEGWLVLDINAHDLPIDEPVDFYRAQSEGPLKNYPSLGNDDRETSYFLRMYLSCYRAAQYLTERPDWDGQVLVVTGGSQGGLQALVTAALHPKITAVLASVPAGCDLNGPQAGRLPGWPMWYWSTQGKDEAKVREAARYYDVVNFASRVTCPVLIGVGLIDTTCPPSGIFAAANQLRGLKEMVVLPRAEHQDIKGSHAAYSARFNAWNQALVKGKPAPLDPSTLLALAHRHSKQGWIYVHLEGSARARGYQHGFLLAREIAESMRVHCRLWEYATAQEWSWLVKKVEEFMVPRVDAENLEEIDGLVEGLAAAGVASTRAELVADNAFFELAWYWWPEEKKKLGDTSPPPPRQSCSAFIATGRLTRDGNIVLGHNTMVDYPEANANIIMDIIPARGQRILWQTWPGWIHSGTDFFVTSAGLVGAETTIGGFQGYSENGIPEFARMRRATQDAQSIDEWCQIMRRGNNGGYANAWLLGDVRSGEIARLELGLKHERLERKHDGYFLGSNVAEDLAVLRNETDVNEVDIRVSSIARRERWKQLVARYQGKIDVQRAQRFEADHYDVYLRRAFPDSRSLCGHFEYDPNPFGAWPGAPFYPTGTCDGKVIDSRMARAMSFLARWGSACGREFKAQRFLSQHPQFDWMKDILSDRPSRPWTVFQAGEKP